MRKEVIEIDDVLINQDADGRYSLTDLWKASGGEKKNQPNNWLDSKTTQEKIDYLSSTKQGSLPIAKILGKGKKQGTYVCKQLVYDYAMWLSPEFNFKVIDTFDAVITNKLMEVDRVKLRHAAASTNKVQNAIIQLMRDQEGKVTKHYHFSNEARLVNFVLTGEFKGRNRDDLSVDELSLLASIENRNSVLIGAKIPYETRKELLHKEVSGFISAIEPLKKIA